MAGDCPVRVREVRERCTLSEIAAAYRSMMARREGVGWYYHVDTKRP